jgi:hypothetical protein
VLGSPDPRGRLEQVSKSQGSTHIRPNAVERLPASRQAVLIPGIGSGFATVSGVLAARDILVLANNRGMPRFGEGQFVELYQTIPAQDGDSDRGGTRGIVQIVDPDHADEAIYLVAFLQSERLDGRQAWLREIDLFPA